MTPTPPLSYGFAPGDDWWMLVDQWPRPLVGLDLLAACQNGTLRDWPQPPPKKTRGETLAERDITYDPEEGLTSLRVFGYLVYCPSPRTPEEWVKGIRMWYATELKREREAAAREEREACKRIAFTEGNGGGPMPHPVSARIYVKIDERGT